ncbi:MAG: hypothetical protein ABWJ98_04340 [Hydrogenothermaceae bacterium]
MSQTDEFLKKTAQNLNKTEKELTIHPFSTLKPKKGKKHHFLIFTLIIAYSFIIYAIYDLYTMKQNSYTILRNFLNTDEILAELEKKISQSVNIEYIKEKEIKSEEELLQEIAEKSLKLPDLNKLTKDIPPINIETNGIQNQSTQQMPILSKRDFFLKKAQEYESMGNYRYAIFFYLRAFVENQSDYNLKYKIATLYSQIGQYELAMESAKDALNIKPDFLPAIEFLIDLYSKTGKKPTGFIDILERAKSYYPNNKDIISTLEKVQKEN